jgi:hypothetical protein
MGKIKSFSQITRIIKGIINFSWKQRKIEKIAKERRKFCDLCSYKGNNCVVSGTGPCCNICGCSLKLKLRVPEEVCALTEINEKPLW